MFALTLISAFAVASAAPQYYNNNDYARALLSSYDNFFKDDVFDTDRFWDRLDSAESAMEAAIKDFHAHFPVVTGDARVVGKQYVVKVNLPGYKLSEIVVKANAGYLMIQAVHKSEDCVGTSSYVDLRTLPSNVNPAGVWGYEDGVLTVNFPLKEADQTTEMAIDVREEVEATTDDGGDADVGVKTDIETNEIPRQSVEATTYAVDLKDQYEFVPIHYRK